MRKLARCQCAHARKRGRVKQTCVWGMRKLARCQCAHARKRGRVKQTCVWGMGDNVRVQVGTSGGTSMNACESTMPVDGEWSAATHESSGWMRSACARVTCTTQQTTYNVQRATLQHAAAQHALHVASPCIHTHSMQRTTCNTRHTACAYKRANAADD